eukprot:CAMPEP_0172409498 /NCGR_PEP_ID=MMETSP1061-20121228/76397_1 /TAXON_ID=37318 /ORGANISM="Pseudo-nitzschia pungens, Strain cf. pungens" /LENGTH=448 /DNA_ID=CAMNT_0013145653 /DNA_START=220 /DNA_END=1566 /DNA_ORIENTATION=-
MTPFKISTIRLPSLRFYHHRFVSWRAFCSILLLGLALTNLFVFPTYISSLTISSNANATHAKGNCKQQENVERQDFVFYDTTWPPLQRVLCGEGYPNLYMSQTLFDLARKEVFHNIHGNREFSISDIIKPSMVNRSFLSQDGEPSLLRKKFMLGDWGTSIFHGTNNQGHRFATLYLKIWKCGNNQIRWMEKKLFHKYNGTYVSSSMRLYEAITSYLYTYNPKNRTLNYNFADTPPPCIYTAIRDPISHFLSGYNEIETRQLEGYNNSSVFPVNATSAPYHIDVPYSSTSPWLRKKRFVAFVRDVLLEEKVLASHHVYSHFYSMSRILHTLMKYNLTLTSYIPSLSNLTTTWPEFVSSTCPGAPPLDEYPHMTKQGQHKSSKDQLGLYDAAKEVWSDGGPIARSLCLLQAFDYACFEDLPEGVPDLCREVFRDYGEKIIEKGTESYYVM